MNPAMLAGMEQNWRELGDAGEFFHTTMGRQFDFTGITVAPPTSTFEREYAFEVGSKRVTLVNVGPAHTAGDTIVHVPSDRTVFTGDILFNESHPIMWTGPVANWIAACGYVLGLDVETVVPGHGPITDKAAVRAMRGYFEYVAAEASRRFDAGMTYEDAARDIDLAPYAGWSDDERIVANVFALYREFRGETERAGGPGELFAAMGRYRRAHAAL